MANIKSSSVNNWALVINRIFSSTKQLQIGYHSD